MKTFLRSYIVNIASLWATAQIFPGFSYTGNFGVLFFAAFVLMLFNITVIPMLKVVFLPLNILTLGIFTWIINVIALYILTMLIPSLKLLPYTYPGTDLNGFIVPVMDFNVVQVAIIASFLVGLISHFLKWLMDK